MIYNEDASPIWPFVFSLFSPSLRLVIRAGYSV
jgi:hypothetical protein